jgi:DNA-binding transcriptional regulator YiaG
MKVDKIAGGVIDLDYDLLMQSSRMSRARIKKIRAKYMMTQKDFAEILQVSCNTYFSWERGVRNPSSPAAALLQIAEKNPAVFLQNRREIISNIMKYFSKSVLL